MTATPTAKRAGWLYTITHPRVRLIATIAMAIVFISGCVLGSVVPDYRMWFYIPAAAAILFWYVSMMRAYNRARSETK